MAKRLRSFSWRWGVGILLAGLFASSGALFAHLQPALAQSPARQIQQGQISQQVYEQIPDLPLEDDYIETSAAAGDSDHTLVTRIARYHYYVKGRSTQSRLDWKLTLADYLGANERINPREYPFATRYDRNPLAGDTEAIRGLSRQQRNDLIQALITAFHPDLMPAETESTGAAETTAPTPTPIITRPGAAELLR
ncbi:hypothetical protein [Almyronema epifaneia]|uniref:Uncharacterized protein n=1 Tax=Almyronema epifaneia S1 TaxID=2991925 RepID=A0ABW6IC61_9CYAN